MSRRSPPKPQFELFKDLLEADAALFQAASRLRSLDLEGFALRVDEVREAIADEFSSIQTSVYKKLVRSVQATPARIRARMH